jgi:hypothetical protein
MKASSLSLLISLIPLFLTGCAGVDPERPAFDAVGGVGAGGIAYEATKNPLIAAGAGAGGVLVSDLAQQAIASGDDKKQAESYAKGESDATKELYWSHQRMKAALAANTPTDQTKTVVYPIDIPACQQNGVNYDAQTVYLPVQEKK